MIVSQWRDRGFLPAYIPTAGQQRYTLNNWHVGEEPLEVRLEVRVQMLPDLCTRWAQEVARDP